MKMMSGLRLLMASFILFMSSGYSALATLTEAASEEITDDTSMQTGVSEDSAEALCTNPKCFLQFVAEALLQPNSFEQIMAQAQDAPFDELIDAAALAARHGQKPLEQALMRLRVLRKVLAEFHERKKEELMVAEQAVREVLRQKEAC